MWVVAADDLGPYLAAEWGWQAVEQIAWARRWRRRRPTELWSVEHVTVVTSWTAAKSDPAHLLALVRGHWTIENRVHWVRDMSFHEDWLHGRAIGGMVPSWLRNIAINLIPTGVGRELHSGCGGSSRIGRSAHRPALAAHPVNELRSPAHGHTGGNRGTSVL